jgi:hypothetical protein
LNSGRNKRKNVEGGESRRKIEHYILSFELKVRKKNVYLSNDINFLFTNLYQRGSKPNDRLQQN